MRFQSLQNFSRNENLYVENQDYPQSRAYFPWVKASVGGALVEDTMWKEERQTLLAQFVPLFRVLAPTLSPTCSQLSDLNEALLEASHAHCQSIPSVQPPLEVKRPFTFPTE